MSIFGERQTLTQTVNGLNCVPGEQVLKPAGLRRKVFISQPMRGKSDEEILAERQAIIDTAKSVYGENVEVIDSFFQGAPTEAKPLWFLAKSLELLSTADIAVFSCGWQEARGCRIEHACAVEYGVEMLEINHALK